MRIAFLVALVSILTSADTRAAGPNWIPGQVKLCDRSCLMGMMDRYTDALIGHDRAGVPFAEDVRFTENTALVSPGDGILWRAKTEPAAFKYYVADPTAGQVAIGTLWKVQGRPALVAIRLKVERGRLLEIEHLVDRNVQERQMPNLQTPRPGLLNDVPASERAPREVMIAAANSYFDAIEGDSEKTGAFADDCERHENGIQTTLTKEPTTGMLASGLPSKLYMMTCSDQIDTKLFAYIHKIIHKIGPRRVLIVDEQKGLVATFPLLHPRWLETRRYERQCRHAHQHGLPRDVRNSWRQIHEMEAFPFPVWARRRLDAGFRPLI